VEISVDRDQPDWYGHVGVITRFIPHCDFNAENAVAFICGPEIMIRFTIRELKGCGLPEEQIYVSMERNMKCGIGHCGHCQLGGVFVCKDGPVFRYPEVGELMKIKEL